MILKKLSEKIYHGCVIESKKFGEASIKVRNDGPGESFLTVLVKGDLFDLECRSPRQFDQFFSRGWKIKNKESL